MDQYLDSNEPFWQQALPVVGGLALGVIATRTFDNLAHDRLHPLVLFGAKVLFGLGLGTMIGGAGYERLAHGFVFGAMADSSITYANQIQYRYLPGAPSAPQLPG